jgi:hypothetical protein
MSKTSPETEILPTNEKALADFLYSIRSYGEAEAKAKLLWPLLGHAPSPDVTGAARKAVKAFYTPNSDRLYAAMADLKAALSGTSTDGEHHTYSLDLGEDGMAQHREKVRR